MRAKQVFEFVKGVNPVKSLNLGYEGKIRTFFRSFNIFDENYEVKESGEIVFNTDLYLSNTQISELPANLTVHGDLDLSNTQISDLPANLTIHGFLDLSNTQIRELPANLTVHGYLDLSNTQIRELPANLTVHGGLYLRNTQISELSNDLKVKYEICVNKGQTELINWIQQSKFKNKLIIN